MESATIRAGYKPSAILMMSAASLACALLVGFSALVRMPLPGTPVPVTLQTLALLGCAGLLGRWYAVQMVAWYLALGFAGAPFFTGGGGVASLFGPTGGYLVGFVAAAAIVGFFSADRRGFIAKSAICLAAALAIYAPGLVWLKLSTGSTWAATLSMGLFPFVVAEIAKVAAAALVIDRFKR